MKGTIFFRLILRAGRHGVDDSWLMIEDYYYYYYCCSRKMSWAGHVARMGERRGEMHRGFWCGNLRERGHLEELGVD